MRLVVDTQCPQQFRVSEIPRRIQVDLSDYTRASQISGTVHGLCIIGGSECLGY